MRKLRLALLGLGHQGSNDHLPAILQCPEVELVAVCDLNQELVESVAREYSVAGFCDIRRLAEIIQPDIAVVAVPHDQHLLVVQTLAEFGVHILKEKPFAVSLSEACEMERIVRQSGIALRISVQRRFDPVYKQFFELRSQIGQIYSIEGRYTKNIARLDEGWRAHLEQSGGGALIDMGYHMIDLLMWYFGLPQSLFARMSIGNRENQTYDVEDTISIGFDYQNGPSAVRRNCLGSLIISRAYPFDEERLSVVGSRGAIEVTKKKIRLLDSRGIEVAKQESQKGWVNAFSDQLSSFARALFAGEPKLASNFQDHVPHVQFIESSYRSCRDGRTETFQDQLTLEEKIYAVG
ncbi:MAG: Gfo/Idh/MocA family oxidoreductase [Bdellovibrionales bacterium]|nr:Gfo/Idh/MocA family oxidoreductase [Bdellovibrionales bacterium]